MKGDVKNLKSSMDRFIEPSTKIAITIPSNLKSSMDRFIAEYYPTVDVIDEIFKIQYG